MGDGEREFFRFLTGGGLTYSSGRCSVVNWPPSVEGRGKSMPSPFFLFVYLRFSDGLADDGGDSAPTDSLTVFPALPEVLVGITGGGGVTPPLASRFAAIFCSLANSALSRLDMIPSLGGRPGPRRRVGWPPFSPPASMEGSALEESESLVLRMSFVTLEEGSLLSLSLRGLSVSSISCSASTEPRSASSSSGSCSSIRSAPVSPMGTSGSRNRIRTPPI